MSKCIFNNVSIMVHSINVFPDETIQLAHKSCWMCLSVCALKFRAQSPQSQSFRKCHHEGCDFSWIRLGEVMWWCNIKNYYGIVTANTVMETSSSAPEQTADFCAFTVSYAFGLELCNFVKICSKNALSGGLAFLSI